jgi:hypothetical protein
MPIVYSFTTTIAMPTSAGWPCMDIGEAQMPNILLLSEVSVSRAAPWMSINLANDLVMESDDEISTILTVTLPIGQKFTFETTFLPTQLPTNLDNLSSDRFFIAVFDAQDNAGGVLISKSGLAIVSSFGNTVMPIAGSQNHIIEGSDYYTLRMVVDGQNNVMDLYITKTSDLPLTGHQLRYTTAAPITPAGTPDTARVEVIGNAAKKTEIALSTLRANCNELVIPNLRPIADTGQDQTAVIGSVIALDGRLSYDPEGEEITYEWSVYGTPEGSEFRLDGSDAFTQDDGDADSWTPFLEVSGGEPWSDTNAPSLQPGDVLIVGTERYVVADTDWVFNATTGLYERGGGFDNNKLRIETDALPDDLSSQAWTIYHQTTFFNDRTEPQPTFVPDVPGMYALTLVVNDGELDSLPNEGLVNIAESNVPFGYVPDVNFIWDYLSDAWGLYDDRDYVTTIWSGFAQIAANILLTAWQLDYAKSMVDIQRTFQRRWLDYRTLYEEPTVDRDDIVLRIIRGKLVTKEITGSIDFGTGETLIISKDGGSQMTTELVGVLSPQEIVDEINEGLGERTAKVKTVALETEASKDYIVFNYEKLLVIHKESTALGSLFDSAVVDISKDIQNDLQGWDGESDPVGDPNNPQPTAFKTSDPLIDLQAAVQKGDLLAFDGVGYEVLKVAQTTQLTTQQDMSAGSGKRWQVSSSVESANSDFTAELVAEGDILILEVRQEGAVSSQQVLCEVTGARNQVIGFNPRQLLELVGGDISGYEISLLGVRRVNSIPVDILVDRIPRLQEVILDPPTVLTENRDYSISTNDDEVRGIHLTSGLYSIDNPPPDILWAEVTFLDNKPMVENNFGKPVGFDVEDLETRTDDLDYLSAVRGLWYAFFNGPSLWNVRVGTQILLGLPFAEVDGIITDINETYNASYIRVLIQDRADSSITRSYFVPRNYNFEEDGLSMIEVNPDTGTEYIVGDSINQFAPLCKGVDVADRINAEQWWKKYHGQGVFLEVDKYFRFLMQADIDVFNIANLVFAQDFVKAIKPHFTYPMWVIFKRIPSTVISVTDDMAFHGTLFLFDHPACAKRITDMGTGGAYRFDDTNESGIYNWAWDGVPLVPTAPSGKPEFLYDKFRLCPGERVIGIMTALHGGGLFPFDWIWAFDDGGGNDYVPLSGPLPSPPPSGGPYGALVGIIKFDYSYPSGWYTRGKTLAETPDT